jgi:hypothetical protein
LLAKPMTAQKFAQTASHHPGAVAQ